MFPFSTIGVKLYLSFVFALKPEFVSVLRIVSIFSFVIFFTSTINFGCFPGGGGVGVFVLISIDIVIFLILSGAF